jgi:hypothetical protein
MSTADTGILTWLFQTVEKSPSGRANLELMQSM